MVVVFALTYAVNIDKIEFWVYALAKFLDL